MAVPVIIDTDPGVDDALALLLAGVSPELEVLAVTTVEGNVSLAQATENARRILPLAWAGRAMPPLFAGNAAGEETAEGVHGADGLGGVSLLRDPSGRLLYPPAAPLSVGSAVGEILRLARDRPGQVTLITLGPLTNLAAALRRDPRAVGMLREIVIMGGAFRYAGNVRPVAEFNIFADPESAAQVCAADLPLKWVPLDISELCLLQPDDFDRLPDTPRTRFARQITTDYARFHSDYYQMPACFLHDPLAVGVVIWPELVRTARRDVDVETEGRLTRGMTVADFRPDGVRLPIPPRHEICLQVEADLFMERFLERLAAA